MSDLLPTLLDRLRGRSCDRAPFTSEHAECVCRLTHAAADEIERLRNALVEIKLRTDAYAHDEGWPLVSGINAVTSAALPNTYT